MAITNSSFGFLPKIQLAAAITDRHSLPVPATRIILAGMVHPRHLPAFFFANSLKSTQKTVLLSLRWTAAAGCDILSSREMFQAFGTKGEDHGRQGICIGEHDRRDE